MAAVVATGMVVGVACSTDAAAQAPSETPDAAHRPQISVIRWQEDWSVLADPALRTEPFDGLKYVALSNHPSDFLSFGVNVRERWAHQGAFGFGLLARR